MATFTSQAEAEMSDAESSTSTLALRSAARVNSARKKIMRVVHKHILQINAKDGPFPPSFFIPPSLLDDPKAPNPFVHRGSTNPREFPQETANNQQAIEGQRLQHDLQLHESEELSPSTSPQVEQLLPPGSSQAYRSPPQTLHLRDSGGSREILMGDSIQNTSKNSQRKSTSRRESGQSGQSATTQRSQTSAAGIDPRTGNGVSGIRTEEQVLRAASASAAAAKASTSSASSSAFLGSSNVCGDSCFGLSFLLLLVVILLLFLFLWWMWWLNSGSCSCTSPDYGCPLSDVNLYGPLI